MRPRKWPLLANVSWICIHKTLNNEHTFSPLCIYGVCANQTIGAVVHITRAPVRCIVRISDEEDLAPQTSLTADEDELRDSCGWVESLHSLHSQHYIIRVYVLFGLHYTHNHIHILQTTSRTHTWTVGYIHRAIYRPANARITRTSSTNARDWSWLWLYIYIYNAAADVLKKTHDTQAGKIYII